jgi:hypothetical protein
LGFKFGFCRFGLVSDFSFVLLGFGFGIVLELDYLVLDLGSVLVLNLVSVSVLLSVFVLVSD